MILDGFYDQKDQNLYKIHLRIRFYDPNGRNLCKLKSDYFKLSYVCGTTVEKKSGKVIYVHQQF